MANLSELSGSNQILTLNHLKSLHQNSNNFSPNNSSPNNFSPNNSSPNNSFPNNSFPNNSSPNNSFPHNEPLKLRILTFNIATHVQLNQVKGSESPMVSLCQIKYSSTQGLSSDGKLSQCTLNATEFIISQKCDLIGLQECVEPSFTRMLTTICQSNPSHSCIGYNSVQLIYNKDKFGEGIMLNEPGLHILEPSRLMIIIWFPLVKLLVVNLHAPHDFDSQKEITNTFNMGIYDKYNIKPDRIIMMGDFNDSYRESLTEITLQNKLLKQHPTVTNKPIQTCCTDSNYSWIGDYIFDSDYMKDGYYGSIDDHNVLMSDHHPVIYTEYSI